MKKSILIVMMFLIGVGALAQSANSIVAVENQLAKNTIVRQWKKDIAIVYVNDGVAAFCMMDYQNMTFRKAAIPTPLEINDFEIFNSTVYFCGKEATQTFVGYFDINTLFSGADSYHFMILNSPQVVNPLKLDLAPVDDGMHLIVVGESAPYNLISTHFIADFPLDLSNTCNYFLMAVEPEGVDLFDDVAVLGKAIAIIDHKRSNGHYLRVFGRPVSRTDHIFTPINNNCIPSTIKPVVDIVAPDGLDYHPLASNVCSVQEHLIWPNISSNRINIICQQ